MSTTVRQQQTHLQQLVYSLKEEMKLEGPCTAIEEMSFALAETQAFVNNSLFYVTKGSAESFIEGRGIWAATIYHGLSDLDKEIVLRAAAIRFTKMAEKVSGLTAERDSNNGRGTNTLPPVCPHDQINLSPREFNEMVLKQEQRLLVSWDEMVIDGIQEDFREFKRCMSAACGANCPHLDYLTAY